MSHIDAQAVKKLIKLSRIKCTEQEQLMLVKELEKTLSYIDLLQEVDTEGVEPCYHVSDGMVNVMRDDIVGETLPRTTFLANAPDHINGLIRVPLVIQK